MEMFKKIKIICGLIISICFVGNSQAKDFNSFTRALLSQLGISNNQISDVNEKVVQARILNAFFIANDDNLRKNRTIDLEELKSFGEKSSVLAKKLFDSTREVRQQQIMDDLLKIGRFVEAPLKDDVRQRLQCFYILFFNGIDSVDEFDCLEFELRCRLGITNDQIRNVSKKIVKGRLLMALAQANLDDSLTDEEIKILEQVFEYGKELSDKGSFELFKGDDAIAQQWRMDDLLKNFDVGQILRPLETPLKDDVAKKLKCFYADFLISRFGENILNYLDEKDAVDYEKQHKRYF